MDDISEQEARAFVGPRADTYLAKWSRPWSFNWAGFFLNIVWLAHRKMYTGAAIVFAVVAFEFIFVYVLFPEDETIWAFDKVFNIGLALICGFKGNGWYAIRMQGVVERLRNEDMPERLYLQTLARHGGTNPMASLTALLFIVILAVITFFYMLSASGPA